MKRTAAIILSVVIMLLMCIAASAAPTTTPKLQPAISLQRQTKPEIKRVSVRTVRDAHPVLTEFLGPQTSSKTTAQK